MSRQFDSFDGYLRHHWDSTYPNFKGYTNSQILSLVNRNRSVMQWYTNLKERWIAYSQVPSFLEGLLDTDFYLDLSAKLESLRDNEVSRQRELESIIVKARKDADAVNSKRNVIAEQLKENDYIFVLSLRFEDLPLKVANNVILADFDTNEARRAAERACLEEFQAQCIMQINDKRFSRDIIS